MNLGQAVAICMYELARSRKTAAVRNGSAPAAAGDLERLTRVLFEVLGASGYVKPRVAAATEAKLRRMVRRMNLSESDAEVWLGMLRQMQWKLGSGEPRHDPKEA
jgi:tRNA/rRNA methyltransferase